MAQRERSSIVAIRKWLVSREYSLFISERATTREKAWCFSMLQLEDFFSREDGREDLSSVRRPSRAMFVFEHTKCCRACAREKELVAFVYECVEWKKVIRIDLWINVRRHP